MRVVLRLCLVTLLMAALGSGCKKSSSAKDKPWPDRPLKRTSATKKGVTYSVLLPADVGAYQDPNGTIWRVVEPDMVFFVKVFLMEMPKSLKAAAEEALAPEMETILLKEKTADGIRVITKNKKDGRERQFIWKRHRGRAVHCHTLYKLSKYPKGTAKKYNQWLRKICGSLQISG